jgi:16S rRNA (guanine527-N7)-methyltransferase
MVDQERKILELGMQTLSIPYTTAQIDGLIAYLDLMDHWNKAYNLTAVRGRENWVIRHLLDSLAVLPLLGTHLLKAHRVIDVGTGAGLPGIPLALMRPDTPVALLDSNGKKTRFLFQAKMQLGLTNITIVESRVEQYRPTELYGAVLSRAFASLTDMVQVCEHLLSTNGSFFAMKAATVDGEIIDMKKATHDRFSVTAIHDLAIPGLNESRSVVEVKLTKDSP